MSTHKHFDKICCVVLALTLVLTVLFMNAERFGIQKASTVMGYESKLFDTSEVHTIDIIMDDWETFTANCKSEEYYSCALVIDNEAYKNVAIRAKGNTSLTQVESYGNDRYSFKIEFDHYDSTKTYYGLDKLCLNNIIQDNTYMKDYLTYQMMNKMGVASPLCSYVYITVNGEDWGLYLAVEGVEESFLQRNYGKDYGELYKPDSTSMGGGRGNGEKFDIDEFLGDSESENTDNTQSSNNDSNNTFSQTPGSTTDENIAGGNQTPGGNLQGGEMPGGQIPNGNQGDQMPDGQMPNGNQGDQMPDGQMPNDNQGDQMPGGFGGSQTPDGLTPPTNAGNTDSSGQAPEGMTLPDGIELPDVAEIPDGIQGDMPGGIGGGMQNGSDDVLLKYIDDDEDSYSNIFDNAKTDITKADKKRLIQALKNLSNNEDLENTVDIEKVIRYFVVHNFVLNFDSYTGSMIHNYYLYENDGQMQMIPWDYNLAFGGFQSMGDATTLVNYPIDSPVSGGSTEDRPMIAWIFENEEYTELYHQYFSEFISEYFDSGYFTEMIDNVNTLISPYVEKDPTKFCTYEEFKTGIETLKEFCLLRAESISGQLDGTIGSTSDTQKSDTLIDAGDLQVSDMGSMNNMSGDMQPGVNIQNPNENSDSNEIQQFPSMGESGDTSAFSTTTPDNSESDEKTDDSEPQIPGGNRLNGQMANGNQNGFDARQPQGEAPSDFANGETGHTGDFGGGQMQPQEQSVVSASTWVLIGVSSVILALGLVIAFRFKRQK